MLHLVVIDMVATHRIVVMQHEGHFLKPLKLFARHSLTHIATLDESVLIEYRKLAVQTIEDMEITIADEVFRCAIAEGDIADVQSGGAAHIHLIIYIAGIFTHIMIETIVWISIAHADTSAPRRALICENGYLIEGIQRAVVLAFDGFIGIYTLYHVGIILSEGTHITLQ